jgi:hypothetical protein
MHRMRLIAAAVTATAILSGVAMADDQAKPRTPPRAPTASAPAKPTQGAQPRAQAPRRTPSGRANAQASRWAVPRTPSRPAIAVPYYPYRYGGTRFSLGFYYGVPLVYPDYGYWWYDGYPSPQYPPYYTWGASGVTFGSVRLDIPQKDASVYVDGYFAGVVDDFDGVFNSLDLPVGPHRIEIRAPGYETLTFDVYVQPNHTIRCRGTLTPKQT